MDPQTISIMIAFVGCFVGLAGWLRGRDGKISNDSEWKGKVDTKLDSIKESTSVLPVLNERLTKVEESSKQAHKRIDEIIKQK